MSGDIVLSSALRSNLLSLQSTQSNIDKVQNALSTGLKVSSALDNPQNYFAARSLTNRAGDLTKLLDGIGQSISAIKQADKSVTSLTKLIEQADSIVDAAASASADAGVANVKGAVDLSDITNLTTVAGISNQDQLVIKVTNPEDSSVTYTVTATISTGDSIQELLTKINYDSTTVPNGSYDSSSEQVVEASLDDKGQLQIKAANGGNLQINFAANTAATAAADVENQAFASALGFGNLARSVDEAGSTLDNAVQITAIAGTKLVSGKFMAGATGDTYADASAVLSTVYDNASAGRSVRFAASTSAVADSIEITINDGTARPIAIQSGVTTIQGLVDKINTDATLKQSIKASYDSSTGEFSIEKISADVKTVEIGSNTAGVAGSTFEADFDFGLTQLSVATSTKEVSEVFAFSGASGELSQLQKDYNKVKDQIDQLVGDSAYRGANLLAGEDLDTYFNADRSNVLTTSGEDMTTTGLGIDDADFSSAGAIGSARLAVANALDKVRTYSSSLANDLSLIQAREEFTKETISNLKEGSDKLTVADQNEEGAKLLALQTRQQLGVTALSLAAQAQQSVLRLF